MMNKKWWVQGVLTAAMVIGLLSGCGGAKENAAQGDSGARRG
ncbi:Uncharacterised protein [Actinobacillus pleuropneumoniae]|nr:Uncharacterised protein [Actinobacillus pleuropneumoniae]